MKLCSACLLWVNCRFDGKSKPNQKVLELSKKETIIPVCPEQLGWLPTPRIAWEIIRDKVLSQDWQDLTKFYLKWADETLKIAKQMGITEAILKQKSPSCGCGKIYDWTFSWTIIKWDGITTKLLKENNIDVISEEDLQ